MRRENTLSKFMLILMVSPLMVSCSSNDESGNDISYTSEEIVQILTGKLEIHGHVTVSDGTK